MFYLGWYKKPPTPAVVACLDGQLLWDLKPDPCPWGCGMGWGSEVAKPAVPAALQPVGCPKGAGSPAAQSFSIFCLFFLFPLCLWLPELSPINCGAFKQRCFLWTPLLPSGMYWLKQQVFWWGSSQTEESVWMESMDCFVIKRHL